jgi:hypothetical protein
MEPKATHLDLLVQVLQVQTRHDEVSAPPTEPSRDVGVFRILLSRSWGERQNAFPLEIAKDKTVGALKDAIKAKKA